jgi:hypothetical protein
MSATNRRAETLVFIALCRLQKIYIAPYDIGPIYSTEFRLQPTIPRRLGLKIGFQLVARTVLYVTASFSKCMI